MITADFAPNETMRDAIASLLMLIQPWKWQKGNSVHKVKLRLRKMFPGHEPYLFFSGRAALYKTLQAHSFNDNDEVMVASFTCEAVVLPIKKLKLKPVFIDISKKDFSLDIEDVTKKLTNRTVCIILQHTYGITPKRDEIISFAKKHSLEVIEDLAHGFDLEVLKKQPYDSLKLLSFGRSKSMSSVFGGAILISNKKFGESFKAIEKSLPNPVSLLIFQALIYKPLAIIIKAFYDVYIGKALHALIIKLKLIPNELSELEASDNFDDSTIKSYPNALAFLLNAQLKKFDRMQRIRLKRCEKYNSIFYSLEIAQPINRYPILTQNREELLRSLRTTNIFLGRWYDKIFSSKTCPTAHEVSEQIINLPTLISRYKTDRLIKLIDRHQHFQLSQKF